MKAATGSSFEAFYAPWKGWIGVNCYPSKTGLSIYFSDITQRRKDQDALRELNADLEARVAARTAELTAGARGCRAGQPREVGVPGSDEPRDPHADERRGRHDRRARAEQPEELAGEDRADRSRVGLRAA